jgi:hypothetical protein
MPAMSTHTSSCPPAPDLAPRPLVLYHGRCADGFGAALAAWRYHAGAAEFRPLSHGEISQLSDLPALAGRTVYILDFSFEADLLADIAAAAARVVLLDHHKSAAARLSGFQCDGGLVHFDMNKSGARLAWEYFFPEQPLPDLLRYVEDRDLWNWHYPQSAGFLAALDLEPMDFERWDRIAGFNPQQSANFIARGQAMDEKFRALAADVATGARPLVFNGQAGLMVNAPGAFHSLVGDMLSRQCGSYALLWAVGQDGRIKVGLRAQRGYDCSGLAESMGGGGHAQACGFRMDAQRLPELLSGSFQA